MDGRGHVSCTSIGIPPPLSPASGITPKFLLKVYLYFCHRRIERNDRLGERGRSEASISMVGESIAFSRLAHKISIQPVVSVMIMKGLDAVVAVGHLIKYTYGLFM